MFAGPQEDSERLGVNALIGKSELPWFCLRIEAGGAAVAVTMSVPISLTQFLTVGSVSGCFSLRLIAIHLR